ncbi:MAG: hypothetical protein K2X48_17325 [Chitinophagaceae bacterium]|nr:hypothetical protein [Chitinophagaceae bacterium]
MQQEPANQSTGDKLNNDISSPLQEHTEPYKPGLENKNASSSYPGISLLLFLAAGYFLYNSNVKLLVIITVVIFIHELGHLLAMKFFNYSNLNIFFIPFFGGAATGFKNNTSQKQEIIILVSGPLPGIIIGTALLLLKDSLMFHPWLGSLARAFLFINLLNLLPIYPLDGGRMLKTMCLNRSYALSVVFSVLSLLVIVYYSIRVKDYIFLVVALLIFSSLASLFSRQKIKRIMKVEGMDDNISYESVTKEQYLLLRQLMIQRLPSFRNYDLTAYDVNSQKEKLLARNMKQILDPEPAQDMNVPAKTLVVTIWIVCFCVLFLPAPGLRF